MKPAPRPREDAPRVSLAIDSSWKRWIAEQRLRGCTVDSMLQIMEGAGISRIDAECAIVALDDDPSFAVAQRFQQRYRKLESVAYNLQRLWASDPQYHVVEKRADLPDEEFVARYVRGCRPEVLTGHTRDWPAMRNWSPEYLKRRFGHLDVDIQPERNSDTNYEQNKPQLSRRVNLGAFVDKVVQEGQSNDYYLTANNETLRRSEFAPLLEDIVSLPPLCDRSQLAHRSSFWFGPGAP